MYFRVWVRNVDDEDEDDDDDSVDFEERYTNGYLQTLDKKQKMIDYMRAREEEGEGRETLAV